MGQKINIAELLKNCPKGMELDCTMFNGVYFDHVDDLRLNSIKCYVNNGNEHFEITLDEHGQYISNKSAKCVIFPKGKTTWEGFQRPFKDGDVLITDSNALCIYKSIHKTYRHTSFIDYYCGYRTSDNQLVIKKFNDSHFGCISKAKLATEEEKRKLFDAIKANGYKWNPETKTLEKLIEPKFKVGDIIQDIDSYKVKITEVNIEDECYGYESVISKGIGGILFSEQDEWELVPNKFDINTLVPFESKVLVRDNQAYKWRPAIWGFYNKDVGLYPYEVVGVSSFSRCIPYEGNEHLLGTTNDCNDFYKTWV